MPHGILPKVNQAKEFLEIAKDFKDQREILREALSNSWDALASKASIRFSLVPYPGTRKKKIMVEITDDGEGMSTESRPVVGSSEIEGFFNLGDSAKPHGSIGSKGHGTKIYYKSLGLRLVTWKNGIRLDAQTEMPPWDSLLKGIVPTYGYDETPDPSGKGTKINIDGFQAKQAEFARLDELVSYVMWFTVLGSFGHYFNSPRKMDVDIKPTEGPSVTLGYGFKFPDEQTDFDNGTETICKLLGPKTIDCGQTEDGKNVEVQMVGALLGEQHRKIVPHTYTHMGLWLCKDFIRVERNNEILEDVFEGQYYYRSLLIFANCQQFDLTANRNNIRREQEEYDLAVEGIKKFLQETWSAPIIQQYFTSRKTEEETKEQQDKAKADADRKAHAKEKRKDRINRYKGRADLKSKKKLVGGPVKEPQNEAETAILLQAMISAKYPGLNFVIGDYNTTQGVDMIVEQIDKDIPSLKWVELVFSLDKLYEWPHPPEGYHCVVCYQLGNVKEVETFPDGQESKLVKKGQAGRYTLVVGAESIDVYVLREILQ